MENRTEKDRGSRFMSSTAAGISTKLRDDSIYFPCLALWVQGRGKRERVKARGCLSVGTQCSGQGVRLSAGIWRQSENLQ